MTVPSPPRTPGCGVAARTGRFVRGRRLDRSPLRRAADRAETIVLALLIAAFLIGAPLAALASGAWAHALARLSLDERRMAAWDADWQATGPRWTTRA